MARLQRTVAFAGQAGDFRDAEANPLSLVSRDLFLGEDGNPLPGLDRWKLPDTNVGEDTAQAFQRHWTANPLVVIGGFEFLIELGVIATWLTNDQTRKDARKLIADRGWTPILDSLGVRGKESDGADLIGKNSINDFFKHSPEVRRESSIRPRATLGKSPKVRAEFALARRRHHCLRLRKAVELLALIEAALRYRFEQNKTLRRTQNYTGLKVSEVYPEIVWDTCWFEPVNYTLSVLPRRVDFQHVLENPAAVEAFIAASGQKEGALYWAMLGVPCKFKTAEAAKNVCNSTLGLTPANVKSVSPSKYKRAMKELAGKAKKQYRANPEDVTELGPPNAV